MTENKLLNYVNSQIAEHIDNNTWQSEGNKLRDQLSAYLRRRRLKTPVNQGTVLRVVETEDRFVLVFDDGYWMVEAGGGYDYCYIEAGEALGIDQAFDAGLLDPVMDVYQAYSEWKQKDRERSETKIASAALKRLASKHGQDFIRKVLDE